MERVARCGRAVPRSCKGFGGRPVRAGSVFRTVLRRDRRSAGVTARVPTADEENAWLGTRQGHEKVATPHTPHIRPDGTDGKRGFVSLVGGGPGSPGLLTVHGRRRLLEADAVVYDRLATSALPCELGPEVELHPVGKTPWRAPDSAGGDLGPARTPRPRGQEGCASQGR